MPKVPQHSSRLVPTVQSDQYAGIQGRAMQEGAEILRGTFDALDKNRRLTQHNHAQARFLEGLDEIEQKYSQDTDYFTLEQRVEKDVEDLKKRVLKEAPDPVVTEQLDLSFGEQGIKFMGQMRTYARKGQASSGRAATMDALDQLKKSYLKAAPGDRKYWKGRIQETLQAMEESGQAWPEEVEKLSQQLDYDLTRSQVFADMDRAGPDAVLGMLEKGEYDLPPETKFELEREIRREAKRRKDEAEKQAKGAYEKTIPEKEAEVANLVLNPAGPQITPEELATYHGAGLSTEDYKKWETVLQGRLQKGSVDEVEFALDKAYQAVDRLYTNQQGDLDPLDAALMKTRILNAVQKQKPQTSEEVLKIAEGIMYEEKKSKAGEIWKKLWSMTIPGLLSGSLFKKGEEGLDTETENTFSELPPAKDYPGEVFEDTKTGVRYKSDGKKWTEVQ